MQNLKYDYQGTPAANWNSPTFLILSVDTECHLLSNLSHIFVTEVQQGRDLRDSADQGHAQRGSILSGLSQLIKSLLKVLPNLFLTPSGLDKLCQSDVHPHLIVVSTESSLHYTIQNTYVIVQILCNLYKIEECFSIFKEIQCQSVLLSSHELLSCNYISSSEMLPTLQINWSEILE